MARRLTSPGGGRLHAAALVTGLAVAGAILVAFARRLYFFGDDWDYLLDRGTTSQLDYGLLTPHNEHWSTVPILLFRGLFAVFGLDNYLAFALPVIMVHLALCALLYAVLTRLGAGRGPALTVALVLAFYGGGAENTLWDFQVGFIAPLLTAFVAIWVWSRWPSRWWSVVAAVVALQIGLMSSGNGISGVVWVVAFVLLTSGLRYAVAVGALPTVLYVWWYLAIAREVPNIEVSDKSDYLAIPEYVWSGLAHALDQVSGIDRAGPALLIGLILAPFVIRGADPRLRALASAGVVTALVQFTLQASTRVSLGVGQSHADRYTYLVLVFLCPSLAMVVGWVWRRACRGVGRAPDGVRPWAPGVAALAVTALVGSLYVVNGIAEQRTYVEARRAMSPDLERLLRGIQAVTLDETTWLNDQPFPLYHGNISTTLLSTPEVRRALPPAPVTARTRLDGQALVNVAVSPVSLGLAQASELRTSPQFVASGKPVDGCATHEAKAGTAALALVSPAEGAEFAVTGPAQSMTTVLEDGDLASASSTRVLTPGQQVFIGVRVPDATLRVLFDQPGTYTVCSATPPAAR